MDITLYCEQFSAEQQQIISRLHEILCAFPDIIVKEKFRTPFYYRKSWICSVSSKKDGTVELSFLRGNELSNANGLLNAFGRKQVWSVQFSDSTQIPERALQEVLMEAITLDEQVPYQSKRKHLKDI